MRSLLLSAPLAVSLACGGTSAQAPREPVSQSSSPPAPVHAQNPLLATWVGPHGGVPPFALVEDAHFAPAFAAAMEETRSAYAALGKNPAPPDFANTIAALERAHRSYERVETVYGVWQSSRNSPAFQVVERELAPKLAAFEDELTQDAAVFARVEAVYQSAALKKLGDEEQRLAWRTYTNLVRAGAKLDAPAKERLRAINSRLATLYTTFSQNVLADEEGQALVLEKEADLAGLPDSVRAGAAAAAETKGNKGAWAIVNTRSAVEPFLTYSTRADLRETVWKTFVQRGDAGAHDNKPTITEILRLRAERAKLLGYPTHAHWRLENAMAKTPERAMELMETVWKPAVKRAREEVADMQKLANKSDQKRAIQPWDYRFYAEKVRKAKYDLDENEVKQYLQLEKLREGMFWVAGELFGFKFAPVTGMPVYHADVRVWEVSDAAGKHVGLWYFDPYARAGKRSGAWMNAYRVQEGFEQPVTPIVSNNANFVQGKPGEPVLISWSDARTLFHEFGHALHGLSSNVKYPSLAGTRVARDYVEFPSQLLEHWMSTPEVLGTFALHHQTGAPIPASLVAKIDKAATFNQGFQTVEYLSAALIDMKLHLAGDVAIDPAAFEKKTLTALGMPSEIVMRHRTPQFSHVFAGDSYSAGYYSYLWADSITADAYGAFKEAGGPYDKAVAERLRKHVFSVGNTIDPATAYRAFRGHDVELAALMQKRGFAAPKPAPKAKR